MTPAYPDNDNTIAEDDLQAYVDGQLDASWRAVIEAYLAAHPGEAARLAAYRAQNIGLHALFDPRPGKHSDCAGTPPRLAALAGALDAQLRDSARAAPPRSRRLRHLAASIALLLTAGAAGWIALGHGVWRHDSLVAFTRQANEAPLQTTADANGSQGRGSERQVVAWLAAQPGDGPARMPDLEALGFHLAGERMLASTGGPSAAQLLYQDEAGQRVTLTMRPGGKAGQTSFTFTRDGDAARFAWQDARMTYSLAGSMAQEKLLKIAEAVSESLHEAPLPAPQEATAAAPASGKTGGGTTPALAPAIPVDPAAPEAGSDPAIDKIPLIPVPLPEASGQPKET